MSETQRRKPPQKRPISAEGGAGSRKKKRKKKKKGRFKVLKILFALVLIVGFAVAGAGLGAVYGILQSTEMLNTSDVMPESYTSIIYDSQGVEIDKLHGSENREYVKLSMVPKHLQLAVVSIEDERFYEHNGIDLRGIVRATVENISNWDMTQGASTITQQLIKNEVLTSEKKIERKVKEQYLAISLESSLEKQLGSKQAAKEYVLELYLNTMSLSHGLKGVEAAAQYYFGKNVGELTLAESACIAGITKNPTGYAPDTRPEANKERQKLVLNKMLELGHITQAEYDQAIAEDVYGNLVCKVTDEGTGVSTHSYFIEAMIDQLAKDLIEHKGYTRAQAYNLIYSGGLKIHSTVDLRMQSILEAAFLDDSLFPASDATHDVIYLISILDITNSDSSTNQSHYERKITLTDLDEVDAFVQSVRDELLDDTHQLVSDKVTVSRSLQAAMVIMEQSTGEVKALVGGRGEKPGDSVFNRATQALRQQGSAMKPLASYAPAIDLGLLMPGSTIIDEPVSYGSWSPQNWDLKYIGPATVRQGIWHSMNVLAVKAFMMVGAETSYKYLEDFGFTTLVEGDKGASTALGGLTQGVSALEQTAAYAAIANGGIYIQPHYYTVVYDHDGEVLLDAGMLDTHRVIKETTAYMLTHMMIDVITRGTGMRAAISGMTVSGKTGTTSDTFDLTFYGYTPYYTAGIWMGYDTPKEIKRANNAHLTIWSKVMSQVHEGLSNKSFERPSGIVTQSFCSATGHIPGELCARDYYGVSTHSDIASADFLGDSEVCTAHQIFYVCEDCGRMAGYNCPEEKRYEVVVAIDENGDVIGKPAEILESALDINLAESCDMLHDGTDGSGYDDFPWADMYPGLIDPDGNPWPPVREPDVSGNSGQEENEQNNNDDSPTTDDSEEDWFFGIS